MKENPLSLRPPLRRVISPPPRPCSPVSEEPPPPPPHPPRRHPLSSLTQPATPSPAALPRSSQPLWRLGAGSWRLRRFRRRPAPAAAGGGEDDDEEEQRPPSPSVKETERGEDDAEESLLKCECKYFAKAAVADAWGDRGKNTLEFLREKEASSNGVHRSRIVLRTSIGKAVLNAGLYKNMSVQVTEKKNPDGSMKKNGIIVQLFNAVEDSAKTIVLLRFAKEETVLQLQKLLEENVKAML